jgi:hypothetical protein
MRRSRFCAVCSDFIHFARRLPRAGQCAAVLDFSGNGTNFQRVVRLILETPDGAGVVRSLVKTTQTPRLLRD